jgi:hypothetical protein
MRMCVDTRVRVECMRVGVCICARVDVSARMLCVWMCGGCVMCVRVDVCVDVWMFVFVGVHVCVCVRSVYVCVCVTCGCACNLLGVSIFYFGFWISLAWNFSLKFGFMLYWITVKNILH